MASIRDKIQNNKIERFHGSFRERDKVLRGFKEDYATQNILSGFSVYYNFIRPHMGLGGFTPAQVSKIDLPLNGGNRWLSLLVKSIESNGHGIKKEIPKKRIYLIEIFDNDGNKIEHGHGLTVRFTNHKKAVDSLELYRRNFEELGYRFELKEVEF